MPWNEFIRVLMLLVLASPFTLFALWLVTLPMCGTIMTRRLTVGVLLIGFHVPVGIVGIAVLALPLF